MRAHVSTIPVLALLAACSNDIPVGEKLNASPAAAINSPSSGASFESTEVVEFLGVVSDPNGLEDIQAVVWTSTIDGEIGNIDTARPDSDGFTRVSFQLSSGNHGVTLRVTDAAGVVAEDTINLAVGEASQEPSATLDEPANFAEFLPGDLVRILATVSDPQQAPETLEVALEITDNSSGDLVYSDSLAPTESGLASTTWTPADPGNYRIRLSVTDDDGLEATPMPEALIVVNEPPDPRYQDQDGDLFSPATGDCDDADATVHPSAPETCNDLADNDCNSAVDDKDLDNDGHVDEACLGTYSGPDPVDDCDDDEPLTHGAAVELADGADNDCDGEIDNGGPGYDDDGDCYCEVGPCVGSVDPTCAALLSDGDCDDADLDVNPVAVDEPDLTFADRNCDGVDGDELDLVFLDPLLGSNSNSGTTPASPVRSWSTAVSVAQATGRRWVAVSQGVVDLRSGTASFEEGLNIAGGYDASAGWARGSATAPRFEVTSAGELIDGWRAPTEFQYLDLQADDGVGLGASSIALRIHDTDNLIFRNVVVAAGAATAGQSGTSPGGVGGTGNNGTAGSGMSGGAGAATCGASTTGGTGGRGGEASCDLFSCDENAGAAGGNGSGGGGSGGSGGGTNGNNGNPGGRGGDGANGGNGAAGGPSGRSRSPATRRPTAARARPGPPASPAAAAAAAAATGTGRTPGTAAVAAAAAAAGAAARPAAPAWAAARASRSSSTAARSSSRARRCRPAPGARAGAAGPGSSAGPAARARSAATASRPSPRTAATARSAATAATAATAAQEEAAAAARPSRSRAPTARC